MHYQLVIPSAEQTVEAALEQAGFDGYADGVSSALVSFRDQRAYWCHWSPPGALRPQFNPSPERWTGALPWLDLPADRYWIHLDPLRLPQPFELVKPRPCDGERITLAGETWCLPVPPRLPRQMVIGASGRFEPRIDPALAWAVAEGQRWRELAQQQDTSHDLRDAATTVYRLLCLNYRLTPEVVNALGLFTSATVEECLIAIIGGRTDG